MASRARKIRFGVFIFITTSLLVIMFALLVGKKLIEQRTHYYINYKGVSVSGLEIGSSVKYHGLTIGRVEDIIIDEDNINNIIVEISVKKDVPIKEDVEAKLVSVGITGLKQIELTGGSSTADDVPPGGNIQPGKSYIENITGRAEVIANKTEYLINNLTNLTREANRERVTSLLENLDTLTYNFNQILHTNKESINKTVANLELTSEKMVILTDTTIKTMASINKFIESEEIAHILKNTESFTDSLASIRYSHFEQSGDSLIKNINKVVNNLDRTINNIDLMVLQSRGDLVDAISTLEETSEILREFARKIQDDPASLLRSKNK
jgi:phospholipid/cholesterol/gamma-HCH transport system substrate-binding protein